VSGPRTARQVNVEDARAANRVTAKLSRSQGGAIGPTSTRLTFSHIYDFAGLPWRSMEATPIRPSGEGVTTALLTYRSGERVSCSEDAQSVYVGARGQARRKRPARPHIRAAYPQK
jgi:hypothetical protein